MTKIASPVPVITIDGPAGVGKGTVGRTLAKTLGYHYLDSGAFYRLVAWGVLKSNIAPTDYAMITDWIKTVDVDYRIDPEGLPQFFWQKSRVTEESLGTEEVGKAASCIAREPSVRSLLNQRFHQFCQLPGLIADGRDMGSVVFPNAFLKIYLTADARERARRRYVQLKGRGIEADLESLVAAIELRDRQDQERTVAPLRPADGAKIFDTTTLPVEEVISQLLPLCQGLAGS